MQCLYGYTNDLRYNVHPATHFDMMEFNDVVMGSILSLYGVQMWVVIYGFGPVAPSWTVSTLFFFYLVFPR